MRTTCWVATARDISSLNQRFMEIGLLTGYLQPQVGSTFFDFIDKKKKEYRKHIETNYLWFFISLRVTNQSFMQMPSILFEPQRGHMDDQDDDYGLTCLNAEDDHQKREWRGTSFKIELFIDVVRLFKFKFNDPWLSIHDSRSVNAAYTHTRIRPVREKNKAQFWI